VKDGRVMVLTSKCSKLRRRLSSLEYSYRAAYTSGVAQQQRGRWAVEGGQVGLLGACRVSE
jgi:hypothetical protein